MNHVIKSNEPLKDKLIFSCVLKCHVALSLFLFLNDFPCRPSGQSGPSHQTIGAEIAAHEQTVEDMRRRNVANLPPSTADGKVAKGGTMLDQLQVTLTPTGELQVFC